VTFSVPPRATGKTLEERETETGAKQDHVADGWPVEELDRLYRSRAGALAKRLVRNGASSDEGLDFVHEAFALIIGRRRLQKTQIERPEAYVAKTSRNLLTDRGRTQRVARQWAEQAGLECPQHHDQIVYLESRDTLRRLEAALMKLRPRTREIFLARRVHGLSYAEIAQFTGLSARTVENQMSKAIAKLSRLMDRR
jgi:RNA polymerase sigma-70 factor (ECF subfamily)